MNRSTPLRRTPMKRTPLRRDPGASKLAVKLPAPRPADAPRAVMASASTHVAAPKPTTHRSAGWLGAVRSIPCVHCGGPAEAAHVNIGKGMGTKAPDCATAALCRDEHRRIDQGKDLSRDERRALMNHYIVLTWIELVKTGKVALA